MGRNKKVAWDSECAKNGNQKLLSMKLTDVGAEADKLCSRMEDHPAMPCGVHPPPDTPAHFVAEICTPWARRVCHILKLEFQKMRRSMRFCMREV
jgi:hypothetical protein